MNIKDTTKVYAYCYNPIEGYKGYIVKKSVIKPILNIKRPRLF